MSLKCPACNIAFTDVRYEGFPISFCSGCQGVFLNRNSLGKIEKTREIEIPMSGVPPANTEAEVARNCPKCQVVMRKRNYGELSTTVIDHCETCQGIWLDAGELERIQVFYEAANAFNAAPPSANAVKANPKPVADTEPVIAAFATKNPAREITCPKCGTLQETGDDCVKCGVIFQQYRIRQRALEAESESIDKKHKNLKQLLTATNSIEVNQQHHLTEALLGFERKNQYSLTMLPNRKVWHIEEQNKGGLSILGRNLFGAFYTFTMHLTDAQDNIVMRLHRKARLYFHMVEIYDEKGVQIGTVSRSFSFFNRVILVKGNNGNRLLKVVGPIWKPWTFNVFEGSAQVGVISKKWTGILREAYTDADKFSIRFSRLSGRKKWFSIAALMLVDNLYFEGKKSFWRHFFSAPGVQVIGLCVGLYIARATGFFDQIVKLYFPG